PDIVAGGGDFGDGGPQRPDPPADHPGMGQVLPPAVWRILHPAVDRSAALFPGVQHPGRDGGRTGKGQSIPGYRVGGCGDDHRLLLLLPGVEEFPHHGFLQEHGPSGGLLLACPGGHRA
ncbi:hypothetical protein chiPu_0023261, partial [Chiloscyllium punctatum]|nr:hypothetical protein [Chiloscyllium punctatum]